MVRIGVFSVLYTVPAVCVIACNVYEYMGRDRWREVASQAALRCSSGYQRGGSAAHPRQGALVRAAGKGVWCCCVVLLWCCVVFYLPLLCVIYY